MFVFDNFLIGIATVLSFALNAYFWIVIISAVLTWVNPDPYNPIVRALRGLTEPVFLQIRRKLPFVMVGGLDLSPIVVLLAIKFLEVFLVGSLMEAARGM